jgi:hypothetical protein
MTTYQFDFSVVVEGETEDDALEEAMQLLAQWRFAREAATVTVLEDPEPEPLVIEGFRYRPLWANETPQELLAWSEVRNADGFDTWAWGHDPLWGEPGPGAPFLRIDTHDEPSRRWFILVD